MSAIAFYITGHGFGHASRDIEIINALLARRPGLRIIVRTSVPRWLFDLTVRGRIDYQYVEVDTGIVQLDSLRLDEDASIARARQFQTTMPQRAADEAAVLRHEQVALVIGDIPALAFEAAAAAGVPAIATGNFTWDWAYSAYANSEDVVAAISAAYAKAHLALRMPMWGGWQTFRQIVDIPFVARHATKDPRETRAAMNIAPDARVVLSSFGGHGLEGLDLGALNEADGYVVLFSSSVSSGAAPEAFDERRAGPLRLLDEQRLYGDGFRYEDIVRAADVVVSKPGYGIIAECIANDTALLYTSRGHFIEYDVLVAHMPRVVRCAFIDHDDLLGGRWVAHLDALLAQPAPPERPRTDGAEVAAHHILELLDRAAK